MTIFYTIRIQGVLDARWTHWFDGLTVTNFDNGEAVLEGPVEDQSVLVGVINQIHSLNLRLISISSGEQGLPPSRQFGG